MKSLIYKIKCAVFGNPSSKRERDPSLDNIRFLLIFFVVFAHILALSPPFFGSDVIYKTIYSFHMPAFIFLFGYYARFSTKRIIFRWGIPYMIFQMLYILFHRNVLFGNETFQFTKPYWLLWYMLVCIFYQLLLPFYDVGNTYGEIAFVAVTFIIGLLVGYDAKMGYYLSLSRFFVFQPWFVMGYYCHKHSLLEKLNEKKLLRLGVTVLSALLVILSVVYITLVYPPDNLLYGSYSYYNLGWFADSRAILYLIALSWLCLLLIGIKPLLQFKIPLITIIGQNTWPIFLAHGFIVRAAPRWFGNLLTTPANMLLLTCCILIVTGNRPFRMLVDAVSLSWLEKFAEPKRSDPKE